MTAGIPRIAILGGGLAGLSLAVALRDHGVRARVRILEPRTAYTNDRTWCFWDVLEHPFEACVEQRWPAWRITTSGASVVARSQQHHYCRLPAAAFYESACARIDAEPALDREMGVRVSAIRPEGAGLRIDTDHGCRYADLVFDARPPAPGAMDTTGHPFLWQDFVGWRVRAVRDAFDPTIVDLMDFRAGAEPGMIRFHYVLPLSRREALVEATAFSPVEHGRPSRHEPWLQRELDRRLGPGGWSVQATEHGRIPMTTATMPPTPHPNIIPIGTRAGAPRPSSGYAFLPIQRHARALAVQLAQGKRPTAPVRSNAVRWLDQIFLARLAAAPSDAPALFHALFAGVPGDRLVRFLGEAGTLGDHLAVMSSLPTAPFVREALRPVSRRAAVRG
jgi:lycopene beta-cyclase